MGGLKLAKPVEIIEAPNLSKGIKLDISLRLAEMPILHPVPEAPEATGGFFPTAGPKMAITPHLQTNFGPKLHMDLDAVLAKDGRGKTSLHPPRLQSSPILKTLASLAVTFGVFGMVTNPGVVKWMFENFGSFLGLMGLPLLGMVTGGASNEGGHSGRITRYRDLASFYRDYWKLDASGGEPKTIKWEGMEEGAGYNQKIVTIGTVNRPGHKFNIDVETSSETNEFHLGPDWRFYEMIIYTPEELVSQSEEVGEDLFSTTLTIHTTDLAKVETIHQQFVAEYQRTGSAQSALDWLMKSPWGSVMFEFREEGVGAPISGIVPGIGQNRSSAAKTSAAQEKFSDGIFEWFARRMGSIGSWQNYAHDSERFGNIPEAKKAHEKIIELSLKQAQKIEVWSREGQERRFELGARQIDYAKFLERYGLLEEASLHYDAAAKNFDKSGVNEANRYVWVNAHWKAYKISLQLAREAEGRGDFLKAGLFYERAGRNVLSANDVPRELRKRWDSTREALLNFSKAALSFKKAGEAHRDLFEGVLREIPNSPRFIYEGEKWKIFFQELIEFLRRDDSNLQNTHQLIRRGPQ